MQPVRVAIVSAMGSAKRSWSQSGVDAGALHASNEVEVTTIRHGVEYSQASAHYAVRRSDAPLRPFIANSCTPGAASVSGSGAVHTPSSTHHPEELHGPTQEIINFDDAGLVQTP